MTSPPHKTVHFESEFSGPKKIQDTASPGLGLVRIRPRIRFSWTGLLMESWGMDQDEIRGTLQHLGDGGVPGVSGASLDGDGEACEVGWERAGVPLEASSPATTLQLGRGPPRDGFGGLGLDRRDRFIRVRRGGTELAVEGLVDEGAQPCADVEVALGAEALETLTGFGRGADMKRYTVQHNDTH